MMFKSQHLYRVRRLAFLLGVVTCAWFLHPEATGQDLLVRYTFDEGSGDALDTGAPPPANGTLGADTTRTTNTPGGASPFAVDLTAEGLDNFVNGGDAAKVDTLESFTLTTWLYLEGLNTDQAGDTSGNVRLLSKQGGPPFFDGFSWNLNDPNMGVREIDNFRLGLFIGGVDTFAFAFSSEDTGAGNSWAFLAATYDANAADNIAFFSGDETTPTAPLGVPAPAAAGAVASTSGSANFGVGFTDADPTFDFAADGFQDDVRVYSGVLTLEQLEAVRLENLPTTPDGDFNDDGSWDDQDINALSGAIVSGSTDLSFDMNGDGQLTPADITDPGTVEGGGAGWLVVGGANNPAVTGGNPFLNADSNLDGTVDGQDFLTWNSTKFTDSLNWTDGNWDATNPVDGQDFLIWNSNKFLSSSDGAAAVPEPAGFLLLGAVAMVGLLIGRRWGTFASS